MKKISLAAVAAMSIASTAIAKEGLYMGIGGGIVSAKNKVGVSVYQDIQENAGRSSSSSAAVQAAAIDTPTTTPTKTFEISNPSLR
ncbi:MAG: hypothetical protein MRQ09_06250 [Candidatus Midichloria sp.]|nr:hypothetical protein [Candidatus Midichloria sp.]